MGLGDSMIRTIGIACLLSMALAGHALARCEIPTISGSASQMSGAGFMYVDSGEACRIGAIRSQGAHMGLTVTQRPAHGTARANGDGVVYQSRRGYRGADSFTFVHRGANFVRTIQMTVTVR